MHALNVNWTAPFFANHNNKHYVMEDFEILTTLLSVLKWREKNGSIKLYTDTAGFDYFEKIGMLSLWDAGIDTDVLNHAPKNINPKSFWAAGKLMALAHENCPTCLIDLDFIVWEKIYFPDSPLVVIHRETLTPKVYPAKEHLITPDNYSFDESFSWSEPACNTAFVFFNQEALKDYYISEALRFMTDNPAEDSNISMVFAEQRLLAMCAKKLQFPISCFLPNPFESNNRLYTHVWGFKHQLKQHPAARTHFCIKCIDRINTDFPEQTNLLYKIPSLKQYLRQK
jgi:hypothetical protein